MIKEFKKFISRGNVLDLAVGMIVGSAFTKIVSSLVDDILTPLLGIVLGGINFSGLSVQIGEANILYGQFIQNIIDFLIVAFCVFLIVKLFNKLSDNKEKLEKKLKKSKDEKEEPKPEVKKDDNIILLEEIRDLLKQNSNKEIKDSKKTKTTKKNKD